MTIDANDARVSRSLFSLRTYAIFFSLVAFNVTCCMLLFLKALDMELLDVRRSAQLTFVNVLFLSLLCCFLDSLRRQWTVERPVKRILQATRELTQGDFSARITPVHTPERMNEFDAIIEDFNKMAAELSSMETLRTDFIANVSHELKTPLAIIQNYATLLSTPALGESERLKYAKTIAEASRRLAELVDNILKLNKLENQQIFPQPTLYCLDEQLRECLLDFEEAWEGKEIDIAADLDEVRIFADRDLLTLIWNNLIANAIKFTPPGGRITVSLHQAGADALVTVSDNGSGMPPEVSRHIFEKFYQGDTSHAAPGNGLGLALVKRIIDIIGGEISVESQLGEGSAFTVRLELNHGPTGKRDTAR